MWRSFFLATGIVIVILGGECLILEKAVLAGDPVTFEQQTIFDPPANTAKPREIKPPEWAPWSLLSTGAVVILYSYTLPRRRSG